MIKALLSDSIVANLMSRCSLTQAQVDTLLLAANEELSLSAKAAHRDDGKVSKGSFIRTLRQGQANIESSIYTLFLLAYLGLIPSGRLNQFARTGDLISKIKASEPDRASVRQLLIAMNDFARGFSGREKP